MPRTIIYDTVTRAILVVDPLVDARGAAILPNGYPSAAATSITDLEATKLGTPSARFNLASDEVTIAVITEPPAPPDPVVLQRIADAAESLNSPAVRDTQARRDSFARLVGVQPLNIPLTQDATPADITFLGTA